MRIAVMLAALLSLTAPAGICAQHPAVSQLGNPSVIGAVDAPGVLAMGPDPGGHTGATVTPESTRTGRPVVDSAREAASGGRTENSGPPVSSAGQSGKQDGGRAQITE
jgi:hypothetical protein